MHWESSGGGNSIEQHLEEVQISAMMMIMMMMILGSDGEDWYSKEQHLEGVQISAMPMVMKIAVVVVKIGIQKSNIWKECKSLHCLW